MQTDVATPRILPPLDALEMRVGKVATEQMLVTQNEA